MCMCAHMHVHTHKLCSDQPHLLSCTSLPSKPRAPLEGVVEISVSFDPEMALF